MVAMTCSIRGVGRRERTQMKRKGTEETREKGKGGAGRTFNPAVINFMSRRNFVARIGGRGEFSSLEN